MKSGTLKIELRRKTVLKGCALLAGIIFIAFLPAWKTIPSSRIIRVEDDQGNPASGVRVQQVWFDLQARRKYFTDEAVTDDSGEVRFPPRKVHGFLWRIIRARFVNWTDGTCKHCYGPNSINSVSMPAPPAGHRYITLTAASTNAMTVYRKKLVVNEDSFEEPTQPDAINYDLALEDARRLTSLGDSPDVEAASWGSGLATLKPRRVAVRSGVVLVFSGGGQGYIVNPVSGNKVPALNLMLISGAGHDHFWTFLKIDYKADSDAQMDTKSVPLQFEPEMPAAPGGSK